MTELKNQQKIYCGIDLFKLIAAILVVLLHTIENSSWYSSEIKFVFTMLAVPFFFITSGFFFCKGLSSATDEKKYFIKYEKNLLKMYVVWAMIIYFPFEIISYTNKYPEAGGLKTFLLLFRRMFIIGPGPYWYLMALMWSSVFLFFCFNRKRDDLVKLGVLIGLLLEISYSCFRGVLSNIPFLGYFFKLVYYVYSWEFNFIMFGIPCMGIGYLIAKNQWNITKNWAMFILLFSTFLRIVEYNLPKIFPGEFWTQNNVSICFIIQAVAYFMLGKNINIKINNKTSRRIRQMSSCIYFSHAIFLYELLDPLLCKYTRLSVYSDKMIFPKMIIVLLLCIIFFEIIKKIDNKHLNVLING